MRLQPDRWSTISRRTGCRSPGRISRGISGWRSISRSIRCASICFERVGYRSHPLELRATETAPRSSLNDLSGTPADRLLEARTAARSISTGSSCRRPKASPRSPRCRRTPSSVSSPGASPLPQAAARDRGPRRPGRSNAPAGGLAIPFADYWRPTAANYWGRVKKAHGLAIGQGDPRRPLGARPRRRQEAGPRRGAGNGLRSGDQHRLHRPRPGGARQRRRVAAARHGLCRQTAAMARTREPGGATDVERASRTEAAEIDAASTPTCPPSSPRTSPATRSTALGALTRIFGTETAHRRARGTSASSRPSPTGLRAVRPLPSDGARRPPRRPACG